MSEMTVEDKIALAQRVSSHVAVEDLDAFCHEEGLPLSEVTSWSTAFETGAELGVRAMVLRWRPERARARAWHEDLKNAVKKFRPRRLRVRADGNRFTAEEIKPLSAGSIVHTPVFQLRAIEKDDGDVVWFLYWRRADGTWWPYAGNPRFDDMTSAVAEVIADSHQCFRLHPLY